MHYANVEIFMVCFSQIIIRNLIFVNALWIVIKLLYWIWISYSILIILTDFEIFTLWRCKVIARGKTLNNLRHQKTLLWVFIRYVGRYILSAFSVKNISRFIFSFFFNFISLKKNQIQSKWVLNYIPISFEIKITKTTQASLLYLITVGILTKINFHTL